MVEVFLGAAFLGAAFFAVVVFLTGAFFAPPSLLTFFTFVAAGLAAALLSDLASFTGPDAPVVEQD